MKKIDIIREFLKLDGDIYKVNANGVIETRLSCQGHLTDCYRIAGYVHKNGYRVVKFKNIHLSAHQIIYAKFNGELDDNLVINHINGNKLDNRAENLELITQSDNLKHKYKVLNYSSVKGAAKITKEIANKIRNDRSNGSKYSTLCERYGLSKSTISYIVNNKIW